MLRRIYFLGSGNWTNVAFLANSAYTDISVSKNSNLLSGETQDTVGALTALAAKNQGETLLSSARMTNPNGVPMWKLITTLTDPSSNTERIYYTVFFMQGSNMYEIQVYGDKSKQSDVQDVANTVFNSTSINKG